MAIEIKAPSFPESVADGEIAAWHKKEGEFVVVVPNELDPSNTENHTVAVPSNPSKWFDYFFSPSQ